ncbi:hypothetical protein RZ740_004780 [Escherichia coli]|nr:hypothetical protein [Escherichia coli]
MSLTAALDHGGEGAAPMARRGCLGRWESEVWERILAPGEEQDGHPPR